jgi:hypothetical protein
VNQLPHQAVLDHVAPHADVIVPMANGEPLALLDVLEAAHEQLTGVRIHQMHALHDRPYLHGGCGDHLRHVSYLLSAVTQPPYWAGHLVWCPTTSARCRGCSGPALAARW